MNAITDFIDHIYFINLAHRTDRKEEFYREMRLISYPEEKITRIEAIYNPEVGALGCSKSHCLAIQTFLNSPYDTCIIFEDDFTFYSLSEIKLFFSNMKEHPDILWDMILLSGVVNESEPTSYPFLTRVKNLQTSSSYCIRKSFAPLLLQNIEEGAEGLECVFRASKRVEPSLCMDKYWIDLQRKYNCFISNPVLGFQRASFSDIERSFVNYENSEFKETKEITSNSATMNETLFHKYMKVVNETSPGLLLKLPHKRILSYPTGFVVLTEEEAPIFPFTVCPLYFCKPSASPLSGVNPHDVVVSWNTTMGSLEKILYKLYEQYKQEGIEKNEISNETVYL